MAHIADIENDVWRYLGHGLFALSFRDKPTTWPKARRYVVIERNQKP
jgi:hypothetical protein